MKHLLVLILLAPACPLFAADAASAERPNVLMIVADDLNDWVGCLRGHPNLSTKAKRKKDKVPVDGHGFRGHTRQKDHGGQGND